MSGCRFECNCDADVIKEKKKKQIREENPESCRPRGCQILPVTSHEAAPHSDLRHLEVVRSSYSAVSQPLILRQQLMNSCWSNHLDLLGHFSILFINLSL